MPAETVEIQREEASKQEKITWNELAYTPQKIDPNLDLKQLTGK